MKTSILYWLGFLGADVFDPGSMSQSTPQNSGSYLYAGYSGSGVENNRPPWSISVDITGTTTDGQTLTIDCHWSKNSAGSIGVPTLAIYRQDYKNTIAGALNRTLITTLTNGTTIAENGTRVHTRFTYVLTSSEISRYISAVFTPKVTGVNQTDGVGHSSKLTAAIAANLPAIYTTIAPQELLLNGGFNTTTREWLNVGSSGAAWAESGTGIVKNGDGSCSFNGSNGLTKNIAASPTADYYVWMKITHESAAAIVNLFELGTNRRVEILTGNQVRARSTSAVTTTGNKGAAGTTPLNCIFEHKVDGSFVITIKNNAGTDLLSETLAATGTFGVLSGAATIFQTLAAASRNTGKLWEAGIKHGTLSAPDKASLFTRLQSLT